MPVTPLLLALLLLGSAVAYVQTTDQGDDGEPPAPPPIPPRGPFSLDCRQLDEDAVDQWLGEATDRAMAAFESDSEPLAPYMSDEAILERLRAYTFAGWHETTCGPGSSTSTVEAWRLLGCSVAYEMAKLGAIDEEEGDVLRLCEQGFELIPFLPSVVVEPPHDDDDVVTIPYGPGNVWELYLQEDGTVVDEEGDEYDTVTQIWVCPGDTIIMHTPPLVPEKSVVEAPEVAWLWLMLDEPDQGLVVWVVDEAAVPSGEAEYAVLKVEDETSGEVYEFGFQVNQDTQEGCEAA